MTILVVMVMVLHLRSALLISSMLPLAVLIAFIAMNLFGVEANVVALAGIAIAIGTIVDMGIIVIENILKHLEEHRSENAQRSTLNSEPSTRSSLPPRISCLRLGLAGRGSGTRFGLAWQLPVC